MSNVEQPYIFISYAHKDKELIYPFITALKEKYAVWFDEGINYGREWEEEIATKLDECNIFLFAVTENSLESKNCRDELTLARDSDKRFINVMFSDDIELPGWFKLRYSRYQMCYYNRLPSAHSVVEDLDQKCEWFEDVRLPKVQDKVEITAKKQMTVKQQDVPDKVSKVAKTADVSGEAAKSLLDQNILQAPETVRRIVEKKQREINGERAKDAPKDKLPLPITKNDIVNAVRCSNFKNEGKSGGEFVFLNQLKKNQINNIIQKFDPFLREDRIVAFCDDTLLNSGKSGILITEDKLYYSFYKKDPVMLSKIKSVKLLDKEHIEITYNDLTTERKFYSTNTLRVYDILDMLLG